MAEVDLAVIGAGLAGCSLIGRLQQLGSDLNIALIEAGRGPLSLIHISEPTRPS